MSDNNDTRMLKAYSRKMLFNVDHSLPIHYARREIEDIVPHREPLLFVDTITHFDKEQKQIAGTRYISSKDAVFSGHFPAYPVYPGCFTVESIAQLALCLYKLIEASEGAPAEGIPVSLTQIVGALFVRPILPDTCVRLLATQIQQNSLCYRAIGQALDHNNEIAAVTIAEMLIN